MRMIHRQKRRTALAVFWEFAMVFPFLFTMLLGLWEVGRIIQVKQIVAAAAREGARYASQAVVISSSGTYGTTSIKTFSSNPSEVTVTSTAKNYLTGAGLSKTAVDNATVSFHFLDNPNFSSGGARLHPSDPINPAEDRLPVKGERFEVKVAVRYADIRWTSFAIFYSESTANTMNIEEEVTWQIMVDEPFNVPTSGHFNPNK